jgi:hypothetical protein
MRGRVLGVLAALALVTAPATAETLGGLARTRGVPLPDHAATADQPLRAYQVLDDARDLLVVYVGGEGEAARLHAARWDRATRAWTAARLDWPAPAAGRPPALAVEHCRSGLAIDRFPGGFLVRAHINPSAECTIVLGPDLTVRAVLAGWPVATLADGRIVYQRNQVHFAAVHPVALALFDPRRPDLALYPRQPYGPARAAHVDRMRAAYSPAWCAAHNHPCDPDGFDEHVSGEVVTDPGGDALAFVTAWDNTTGWSDTERWGRLEPFRELRAGLSRWDGHGAPPAALYRDLAAGLARARNLQSEAHIAAAMAAEPGLGPLLAAALASRPAAGQDERSWLVALDAGWADARTWQRLGRAVTTPDEFTEVVHVYAGLRRPDTMRHREVLRSDFESRFGPGAPRRALEPDVLREILPPAGGAR